MANRKVVFDIEANDKTDQGIANSAKDLEKLKAQTESAGNAARSSGLRFTELNSVIQVGKQIFDAANAVYQETITKLLNYADVVRTLTDITGETSEEMSRVAQLADDYKISIDKLTLAQKSLAQQGKSLNIETLARMSDEYVKLNTGQERQIYLTKNLGRQGADYAEMLSKGGDALRKQAAAISDGLILGEKQLQQARELEIAQDDVNDAIDAMRIALGVKLLPEIKKTYDAILILINRHQTLLDLQGRWGEQLGNQGASYDEYARKILENARATGDLHYSVDAYLKLIESGKGIPEELAGKIGLLSETEYNLKYNTDEAADSLVGMRNKMPEVAGAVEELNTSTSKASDYFDKLTLRMVYNRIAAQLDGDAALSLGLTLGLIDVNTYSTITAIDELTKKYDINKSGVLENNEVTQQYLDELRGIYGVQELLKDKTVTYVINVVKNGLDNIVGSQTGLSGNGKNNAYIGKAQTNQAAGGSGIVPPGYNHDNFLMGLSSGERWNVTPSSRVGASDKGNGGGGGNVYNFNVSGASSPQEFLREVARLVKQQGGLPQ